MRGPVGIIAHGAYLPRRRLSRAAIAAATQWVNPGAARAQGHRSACNWDEDAITMAVEAARDCLEGVARARVETATLASTTAPFADRSNAGLVATALGLGNATRTFDVGGSQRAATSALLQALREPADAVGGLALLVGAERRLAKPGSEQELAYGHGSAAVLLGCGAEVIAELLGSASEQDDFVDHYRMAGEAFDYGFEERWIRDQGYLRLLPRTIGSALTAAGVDVTAIDRLLLPLSSRHARSVAQQVGIAPGALGDDPRTRCGDLGSTQPLFLLSQALSDATPGQLLVLAGFGQGCDVLVLRVTAANTGHRLHGARRALEDGAEDAEYLRFLAHCGLVEVDHGMRAERDARTAQSAHFRRSHEITGFVGGRCRSCGTVQFPRARACVNPHCRRFDTLEDYPLAECRGHVKSFTEDWLAYSPSPPLVYGNVEFDVGGTLFAEFADTSPGELQAGTQVRFVFRVKDVDRLRRFRRYFWKAVPVRG